MVRKISFVGAIVAAALNPIQAKADEPPFYKGKQINLIIAAAVGGGYDLYARLVARHLGKHLPGAPNIVPQNMMGGGGNTAAGYVYATAPKDGTVIGAATAGIVLDALLLDKARINHDPRKFKWIGSAASDSLICVLNRDAGVKSFDEIFQKEAVLGVSGGTTRDYPQMMNKVLGTKFKLITGYPGTRDVGLAMERKEVDGMCGMSWLSLQSQRPEWLKQDIVRFLVQEGADGRQELGGQKVPLSIDYAKTDAQKQVMALLYTQNTYLRPFMAPPETPEARVAELRAAFLKSLGDPELLAEAAKARLVVDGRSGEDMTRMVESVFALPKSVHDHLRQALTE